MRAYLPVFAASAGAALLTTPLVRRLAVKLGAIDRPADRKVHPKPTPTLGGIAILLGIAAGLGAAYLLPTFRPVFQQSSELQGVLIAGAVISAIGVWDDMRSLRAPAKVAGQVLAAGLLILNGVVILFFWFPGLGIVSGPDLFVPLTVLWVLVMVNAINLMDGLDGLAAGIVAIAAAAFFVYATIGPSPLAGPSSSAALLCVVAAGAAIGFLPFNFYPARIFMGDSGSMLLGVVLAAATVSGVGRTVQPSGGDLAAFSIPILIPVIVLGLPLVDVLLAILRRLRRGRPIFAPDKEHIHHQLREIGHTHRQAVLLMYFWSLLLAGSALAITFIDGRLVVGTIVGTALLMILATFVPHRIREARRARRATEGQEPEPEPPGEPGFVKSFTSG